jgi:cytochrome c
VVFSLGIVSDAIFASPVPEKPGYAIEAAEEARRRRSGRRRDRRESDHSAARQRQRRPRARPCTRSARPAIPIEKGGANKTGPNLWDIVNRPIASHEGFSYSAAMKEFSQGGSVKWDYEHLDHFLTSPKGLVKGTAMGFAGLKKTQERANLIAYLRTLSDTPAPLPEAGAAAPAPENASAPAEGAAAPAEKPAEGAAPAAPAEGAAPAAPARGPACCARTG